MLNITGMLVGYGTGAALAIAVIQKFFDLLVALSAASMPATNHFGAVILAWLFAGMFVILGGALGMLAGYELTKTN